VVLNWLSSDVGNIHFEAHYFCLNWDKAEPTTFIERTDIDAEPSVEFVNFLRSDKAPFFFGDVYHHTSGAIDQS
jgi:hypothetical protein